MANLKVPIEVKFTDDEQRKIYELCKLYKNENTKLREELDCCLKLVPNCDKCEAMLDCWECLRADSSQKERKRLDYENAKLRELVQDMWFWGYEGHMDNESQEWQIDVSRELLPFGKFFSQFSVLGF